MAGTTSSTDYSLWRSNFGTAPTEPADGPADVEKIDEDNARTTGIGSQQDPASFLTIEDDADPIALLLPAVQAAREAAGGFNGDGAVDAADFLFWQRGSAERDDAPLSLTGNDGAATTGFSGGIFVSAGDIDGDATASWGYHLLPYMEQHDVYL